MVKMQILLYAAMICLPVAINAIAAETGHRTVIYDNRTTEVTPPLSALPADDLWVTLDDLKRATGFVIKPQGVCRDELCFPIPKARSSAFLSKQRSTTWFNLSEFARLLRQPIAHEKEVWYFGPRPDVQNSKSPGSGGSAHRTTISDGLSAPSGRRSSRMSEERVA